MRKGIWYFDAPDIPNHVGYFTYIGPFYEALHTVQFLAAKAGVRKLELRRAPEMAIKS